MRVFWYFLRVPETNQINPTLLRDWQGADVTGWMLSEKLDGWRMLWDGERFISRQGLVMDAPAWFMAGMPAIPLDGELFAGRGEFGAIQGLISSGWHGLTYQVFDAPAAHGGYAARHAALQSISLPSHAAIIPQVVCESVTHYRMMAIEAVLAGGEGCVARDPNAAYIGGRTASVQRFVPQPPEWNRRKI
jgi:DNA ligase-1